MKVGLLATLALVIGCEEVESEVLDGALPGDEPAEHDAGAAPMPGRHGEVPDDIRDAGQARPDAATPPKAPAIARTDVPDALVGAWQAGPIDFALWENYREGYWAGRDAVPTREAMVLEKDGDATFYRYEFAFGVYEELIDCAGSVAFHGDGTFTFYPVSGRKRFYDTHSSSQNVDRALSASELSSPELAGTRAYAPLSASAIQITVPSSAPYNWYRKE